MNNLIQFQFLALDGQVDEEKGIIKDVSVITSGVEARGHKLHTDLTTLEQMKACADEAVQVPVKWNHKTGADAVNGFLVNFRIIEDKLKADWHLLKKHERYEQALELAQKMPKGVGLSASFRGKSEKVDGKMFARCAALPSVDLVATPAANPDGLFSELPDVVDTDGGDMSDTNKNAASGGSEKVVDLSDVLAGINALNARMDGFEKFQSDVAEAIVAEEEAEQEFAEAQERQELLEAQQQTEFATAEDGVAYFEQVLEAKKQEEFEAERNAEFSALEAQLEQTVELNEKLALQNQALAKALGELSDSPMEFSVSDGGGVELSIVEDSDLTEFEARVKELESEGKEPHEAVSFAVSEDEERYTAHLEAKGALG